MSPYQIFISHTSQYKELATGLRHTLQALSSPEQLQIKIHEDMTGGTHWRDWIEETVRTANAFVLLYPHESVNMEWPGYEVGRFLSNEHEGTRRILWIRNPEVAVRPGVFSEYQEYSATEDGFLKFFKQLLAEPLPGRTAPLNRRVGILSDQYYQDAKEAAADLTRKFAEASITAHYHTRRLVISPSPHKTGAHDLCGAKVEGNPEGLMVIGMMSNGGLNWNAVRQNLGDDVKWPAELERTMRSFRQYALAPSLSPFAANDGELYIPVVSKSETVGTALHRLSVNFVQVDLGKLGPLLDWALPKTTPSRLAAQVRLLRVLLRVRYDVLEPCFQQASKGGLSKDECVLLVDAVISGFEDAERVYHKLAEGGIEAFKDTFDQALHEKVEAALQDYLRVRETYRVFSESIAREQDVQNIRLQLIALLQEFLDNNAAWLDLGGTQFAALTKIRRHAANKKKEVANMQAYRSAAQS